VSGSLRLGAVLYYSLNYLSVFVAIYIVRKCKKLRRIRSRLGFFCVAVLFLVGLSLFRRIAVEMCVMVTAVMISGSLRTQDYFELQSCVCMYIMNVIGQVCSRSASSMMCCQVRYGFWVLC
jgi:uncharacterized membrane protein